MFAPKGFSPISDLIEGLHEIESERREWLQSIVSASGRHTETLETDFLSFRAFRARVYSYQEVRLLALEKALEPEVIYACHPNKGTWRFGFPVFMRLVGYRDFTMAPQCEPDFFDVGFDWRSYEKEVADCVQEKRDPWAELFLTSPQTSPSLFFNERNGLLDFSECRLLESCLLDGFAVEHYGYPFKMSEVEPFEGWSLCVESVQLDWNDFLRRFVEALGAVTLSAAVGDDFLQELQTESPQEWEKFLFGSDLAMSTSGGSTIAAEARALNFLKEHISAHGLSRTKAELKEICPEELSARGFERVWGRLREDYPELARPGRRGK